MLTGTLGNNVKISIANGATVTLNNATINGENEYSCQWAGLNCLGDATIILKDGTTNTVKGFNSNYPGIHVPSGSTLTIQGTGTLDARSNGWASGIGGGWSIASGNITINGGTITATGGNNGAGIGCGKTPCGNISITGGTVEATGGSNAAGIGGSTDTSCGTITISGGTVTATGGSSGAGIGSGCRQSSSSSCETITISGGCVTAKGGSGSAGIGSGSNASCGDITIENTVTSVSATKGSNSAQNSIGKGYNGTCGTVKFGNVTVYNGSAWSPSPMVAGTYDLLTLAISTTTNTNDTWRLTPISAPVGVVAVDLALPSGLLWASCNVGATSPEQYGDYVAWGETTSKAVYSWDTYAFDNSVNHDGSSLSKYTGSDYSVLRPEDDAARQNWGLNWRMPTKTEWEELINNTDQEWITVSGVKGGKFMKKTNHSVYIFLPATGLHSGNGTWGVGTNGRYWSSSLSLETEVPKKSWLMCCDEGSYKMANDGYRYYGRSVRPVKDAN